MLRRFRHPCKQIDGVDDPAGLAAPAANLLPPLENLSGRPARVFLIFHMGGALFFRSGDFCHAKPFVFHR